MRYNWYVVKLRRGVGEKMKAIGVWIFEKEGFISIATTLIEKEQMEKALKVPSQKGLLKFMESD